MDVADWDFFEEQIATLVLVDALPLTTTIYRLCTQHPARSADVLLLAAISFVTHLDHFSDHVEDKALARSHRRYRVIAALAADIALLSAQNHSCADLSAFWQTSKSSVFNE